MDGKRLYVDGLNFSNDFGFVNKRWNLDLPIREITKFVEAAVRSGYTIKIFIDAGIESDEAIAKWKSRREEEVKGEYRDVPQGLSILMGDIFRSLQIEVCYSPADADNDDCIAAHAHSDGADILSNDKDFFRYETNKQKGRGYNLYGSFVIEDGLLKLKRKDMPRPNARFPAPPPKAIIKPPVMLAYNPAFNIATRLKLYRRGSPSPLVKILGNPNVSLVNLRRAIYAKLGCTESIKEEWPDWDNEKEIVVWHSAGVEPTHEFDDRFLIEPDKLFFEIFPEDLSTLGVDHRVEDWEIENHIFAQYCLLFELLVIWNNNSSTILDYFKKYTKNIVSIENSGEDRNSKSAKGNVLNNAPVEKSCANWLREGYCRFGDKCFDKNGHQDCLRFAADKCRRGQFCRFRHAEHK